MMMTYIYFVFIIFLTQIGRKNKSVLYECTDIHMKCMLACLLVFLFKIFLYIML